MKIRFWRSILLTAWGFVIFVPADADEIQQEEGGAGTTRPASARSGSTEHWAFRPPQRPGVSKVVDTSRVRTPIDAFVLDRLEKKGLTFAPDADRVTLLRRAFLDLWGLPPAPQDIDAFLADDRPEAFDRLLDRLLASPHFGERWARHWLDVVGYADTVGFDFDSNQIIQTEGKWRYRDYVIDALNKDMPYDQFVREQLAGDEMVDWRGAKVYTPQIKEHLIATGFLRNARDESHEPESNIPLIYYGVLHNTVDIVGNSLLGLTLQCARCHDHKFDPISQKEYYELMAFLTPAYNPKNWKPVYPWKPEIKDRGLPDVSAAEKADIDSHNKEVNRQIDDVGKRRAELYRPYEDRLLENKLKALPEPIRNDTRAAIRTPETKRNEIQKYLAGKFESSLRVKPEEVKTALSAADRSVDQKFDKEVAELKKRLRSWGKIQALYDVGPPPPTLLLKRGNHETPGREVGPAFFKVLTDGATAATVPAGLPPGTSGRRLALAQWITTPNSRAAALLARVMVNRLWQHLFGEGIVPTPENLGLSGEPPTHPELLEWLGSEFARTGWRIKPMLKLMMTSTAYRQASRVDPVVVGRIGNPSHKGDPQKVDPSNQLLWKMRLRRLEAEAIRDSILAVSGQLDAKMGGPPILTNALKDGMVVIDDKHLANPADKKRRSVYLLFRRAFNLSMLTVFDQPQVSVNCTRRDASAVPLQALAMLNDAFVAEQAVQFAGRVKRLAGDSRLEATRAAFRLALARTPTPAEEEICSGLLERQARTFREAKAAPADADHKALVQLCHMLLNTSEFLYAE
jgi:hypothetical protein